MLYVLTTEFIIIIIYMYTHRSCISGELGTVCCVFLLVFVCFFINGSELIIILSVVEFVYLPVQLIAWKDKISLSGMLSLHSVG